MKQKLIFGVVLLLLISLIGCGAGGSSSTKQTGTGEPRSYKALMPEAGTSIVSESKGARIDASNNALGYVIITAKTGRDKRLKAQIKSGEKKYDFDLNNAGKPEVFPLSMGNGKYTISVMENVSENRYTPIASLDVNVTLSSEFAPFLVPNQFVNYTKDSKAVQFGYELTKKSANDLEVVDAIYDYIIKKIEYDTEKAATVKSGYLPDVDETLATGKGICFDYSALAAAMLRAHDIPTKLMVGKAAPAIESHAWNMIYIENQGWIKKEIQFDGKSWSVVDTTLGASGSKEKLQYIDNYQY